MSISVRYLCLALYAATFAAAQVSTGSGVDNVFTGRFIAAFQRGNFPSIAIQPPVANVQKFGSTGLVQEFNASLAGGKAALVLPNSAKVGYDFDVLQVLPGIYAYYFTLGSNTVGYPTQDTQDCGSAAYSGCLYQLFTNNYALFYEPGNASGTTFAVYGDIYARWYSLSYIYGALGIATSARVSVTSTSAVTADRQTFAGGEVFDITSGTNKGNAYVLLGASANLYDFYGGATGSLGLPTSDEVTLAGNMQRQQFEFGKIQYPTGGTPVVQFPVSQIQITPSGTIALQSGQTVTLTATYFDTAGLPVTGRTITWATTNGQVVSIQQTGMTAVIKALGSGTAMVTAISEGKVSTAVTITVNAPCCAVGEGAPTTALSQTFQDAVTRGHLSVTIPGPNPVKRVSTGYTQDLLGSDGVTHYLLAKGDQNGLAYVVSGTQLAAYLQAGGPTGVLGFPLSDVSSSGTQLFAGGALAGSPVQTVTGAVLLKWALLKYETGPAGLPTAAATTFRTQSGYSGQAQQFAGGVIYGVSSGNRAGQGYVVSGLILTRYAALAGPAGSLGLPVTDPFTTGAVTRQNFENGYIDFSAGALAAQEHLVPRTPAVTANPASALPGSRLHLSVSGFANGATIRVSVTGQSDFTVTTQGGSYDWDILIDSTARTSTVTVKAVDVATNAAATGSYSIRTVADANPTVSKTVGDNQTGAPGTVLPIRLGIAVRDSAGAPIAGVAVTFSPSPGAQASPTQAITDSSGMASTIFRLPAASGLAAVTVNAFGRIAIFNAQSTGSSILANFPQFSQAGVPGNLGNGTATIADKGSLLTVVAAVVRYYQNQGALPAPNGLADPQSLNQFLAQYCTPAIRVCDGFVSAGGSSDQILNLFRVGAFIGGGLVPSAESTALSSIRDLVGSGSPVILSLGLQSDGIAAGGNTVAATGVASDGSLLLFDPNPQFGRASLNDYLNGFAAGGHLWKGSILSAVRLIPGQLSQTGFVFSAVDQSVSGSISVQSAAGACGAPFVLQGTTSTSQFVYCDGSQALYLASVAASGSVLAGFTDLAPGGTAQPVVSQGGAVYQLTRSPGLTIAQPATSFTAAAVVNAASFTAAIAPGEIVSIFGSALSGPGSPTTVSVGGLAATVLVATPFQVNAQIPGTTSEGTSLITVKSPYGTAEQPITVMASAPGIFVLGANADGSAQGAIVNASGTVNSQTAPAKRSETLVIYGTGLGAVVGSGSLSRTAATVTVNVSGSDLPVAFAGLTPGFIGLYQVNVTIPAGTPPGLSVPLYLREGGQVSNTVSIALQ